MTFDLKGRGRMIFALIGGILFLVLNAVFPQLPFTETQIVSFMAIIAAYILGEGISGKTINDNVQTVLKSQKFMALVAGIVVSLIKGFFPSLAISDAEMTSGLLAIMTFIVGAGAQKTDLPEG